MVGRECQGDNVWQKVTGGSGWQALSYLDQCIPTFVLSILQVVIGGQFRAVYDMGIVDGRQ